MNAGGALENSNQNSQQVSRREPDSLNNSMNPTRMQDMGGTPQKTDRADDLTKMMTLLK
jgi:hypothetical protein